MTGVYAIVHSSGRVYIGATSDVMKRWREHRTKLTARRHENATLQAAFDTDPTLHFAVLEICGSRHSQDRERIWMHRFESVFNRWNGATGAEYSLHMAALAQARWRDKSPAVRSREARDRLARTVAKQAAQSDRVESKAKDKGTQ